MNELSVFNYEGAAVRTVMINDELWWVLKDVCGVLALSDVSMTAKRLDDDELTQVKLVSGGQMREMIAVNESGLYNVILRSDKPEAKAFRKWVTHEVLPSIRRSGMYITGKSLDKVTERVIKSVINRIPGVVAEEIRAASAEEGRRILAMNAADKAEAEQRVKILFDWREYRAWIKSKEDADKSFVARFNDTHDGVGLTRQTLYRWWREYNARGDIGLVDMRGRHGNHRQRARIQVSG